MGYSRPGEKMERSITAWLPSSVLVTWKREPLAAAQSLKTQQIAGEGFYLHAKDKWPAANVLFGFLTQSHSDIL